jgi:hypothetical protein
MSLEIREIKNAFATEGKRKDESKQILKSHKC